MRASTFVAEIVQDTTIAPSVVVPVVGGHSGVTIIPLLSQSSHPIPSSLDKAGVDALVNRIQFGGDEVVKAKDGAGSATLSMAAAGAEFAEKVLRAIGGEKGIVSPSYVNLLADAEGGAVIKKEIGKDLAYFSSRVELGVRAFLSSLLSLTPVNLMFVLVLEYCSPTVSRRSSLSEPSPTSRKDWSQLPFPISRITSARFASPTHSLNPVQAKLISSSICRVLPSSTPPSPNCRFCDPCCVFVVLACSVAHCTSRYRKEYTCVQFSISSPD